MRLVTTVCALGTLAIWGCGAAMAEWDPIHEGDKEYAPVVETASRVKHAADACRDGDEPLKIGIVHAKGEPGDTIPAIAKEAAAHGGTHYVVGGDKSDGAEGTALGFGRWEVHETRATWAVVYRCGS